MRGRWEPSDAQWQLIEPTLRPKRRAEGRGCPWQDIGAVLQGIWQVLGTGARGRELPQRYPPHPACHRRFQPRVLEGKLERLWRVLAEALPACGRLPREEAFIGAPFPEARKRASRRRPPGMAKGENHRSRRGSQSCSRRYYRARFAARKSTCRSRPQTLLPRPPPAVIDQRARR
jgi:transposase